MIILKQREDKIVNFDNCEEMYITSSVDNLTGKKAWGIHARSVSNYAIWLGDYESVARAKKVITDIYNDAALGYTSYIMPRE